MRSLPLLAPALAAALTTVVLTLPAGAGEPAAPTCRGLAATVVGDPDSPGSRVTGTTGDDVIVSNGVLTVMALAGDDVVCTTRTGDAGHVNVFTGPGEDVVDRTGDVGGRFARDGFVDLGPGYDEFYGGRDADQVRAGDGDLVVGGGHPTGADPQRDEVTIGGPGQGEAYATVRLTGPDNVVRLASTPESGNLIRLGRDGTVDLGTLPAHEGDWAVDLSTGEVTRDAEVFALLDGVGTLRLRADEADGSPVQVTGSAAGEVLAYAGLRPLAADLAGGADELVLDDLGCATSTRQAVAGGAGRDLVTFVPKVCGGRHPGVDLGADRVTLGGTLLARVPDFEDAAVVTGSRRATLVGDNGANRLTLIACGGRLEGRAGTDHLYVTPGPTSSGLVRCPGGTPNLLVGGGGDDVLRAETSVEALMLGGPGRDRARGEKAARDVCVAEVRRDCHPPR